MAGTITGLATNLNTVPGGTATRVFTLRQTTGSGAGSASSVGTAITYTAAQNGITIQSESISVAAGDRIAILHNTTNTPTASLIGWGIVFKPTTIGQFILPTAIAGTALGNAAANWTKMSGGAAEPNVTETVGQMVTSNDFSLKGFTMCALASPGVSPRAFTLSLRNNGADASTTYATDINAAAFCPVTSVATVYPIPANFDLLGTQSTPSGTTPTAVKVMVSWIGYIAP